MKRTGKEERGQSLVEMAILLPLLLLLMIGLLDLGRAYYVIVALRDAADEGASYASIAPTDVSGVQARVADATGGLITVNPGNVSVTAPTLAAGRPVTVTVNYHYDFYLPLADPFLPEGGITLRGVSTHTILND